MTIIKANIELSLKCNYTAEATVIYLVEMKMQSVKIDISTV